MFVTIILPPTNPCKEMVLEMREKVLPLVNTLAQKQNRVAYLKHGVILTFCKPSNKVVMHTG